MSICARIPRCGLVAAAAGLVLCGVAAADTSHNQKLQWAPDVYGGWQSDQIIVKVAPGVQLQNAAGGVSFGDAGVDGLLAQFKAKSAEKSYLLPFGDPELAAKHGLDRYYTIYVPARSDTPAMAKQLAAFGNVFEYASFVGIGGTAATTPNDPNYNVLWGLHNVGQNIPGSGVGTPDADIDAPEAWDTEYGDQGIVVAVIDSGVNVAHADLAFTGKFLPGWNTVLNNNSITDNCPHGTHVTGTVAAQGNNGIGVVGVNWKCRILPIKVLTGCSGNSVDCGEGIIYAADNGAHIATMSLQYYDNNAFQKDACAYAWDRNVLVLAATGNNQGNNVAYPAKFPKCMGIGATTNKDAIAGFSNWGPEVTVSAPGQDVYSTVASGGYGYLSGTSMATPHTAGLASLIWDKNPNLRNYEIEQILINSADDKGAGGFDNFFGWGRINARTALTQASTPDCSLVDVIQGNHPDYMAAFSQADLAQSFKPTANTSYGASLFLQPGVGTSDTVTISLWTKLPNQGGAVKLAQGSTTGTQGQWCTVGWNLVYVTPGQTYYLVFTGNNTLGIAGDTSNPYPDGQVYANSGYGSFPNFDYTFAHWSQSRVRDQNQPNGPDYMAGFTQPDLAQSFKQYNDVISGAGIHLRKGVGTSDTVTISLWNKLPNAVGAVMMARASATGSHGQWVDVHWGPVTVTPGATYFLVFTGNNTLGISGDTSNPYPDGQVYANAGYDSFPNFDYTFRTWAAPDITDQTQLGAGSLMANFSQTDLAQSFKPAKPVSSGAGVQLGATGTEDTVTIALYDGLPNFGGTKLAQGTAMGIENSLVEVFWDPVSVSVNKTYYLVFGGNTTLGIRGDVADPYPHGQVFANDIGFPDYDYTFRSYASCVPGPKKCKADCNDDGFLDIDDFICFQVEWAFKTSYGDFNGDGVWDVDDFVEFQVAFGVGCP